MYRREASAKFGWTVVAVMVAGLVFLIGWFLTPSYIGALFH